MQNRLYAPALMDLGKVSLRGVAYLHILSSPVALGKALEVRTDVQCLRQAVARVPQREDLPVSTRSALCLQIALHSLPRLALSRALRCLLRPTLMFHDRSLLPGIRLQALILVPMDLQERRGRQALPVETTGGQMGHQDRVL